MKSQNISLLNSNIVFDYTKVQWKLLEQTFNPNSFNKPLYYPFIPDKRDARLNMGFFYSLKISHIFWDVHVNPGNFKCENLMH